MPVASACLNISMNAKIKDNIIFIWVSLSLVLLGSIILSLVTPTSQEKIIETEIYTVDDYVDMEMFNTYQNRVDIVESKILSNRALIEELAKKYHKMGQENDLIADLILFFLNETKEEPTIGPLKNKPTVEALEVNKDGSSTVTRPPKFRLHFKSPSSENK